jgi:hypothetical protein
VQAVEHKQQRGRTANGIQVLANAWRSRNLAAARFCPGAQSLSSSVASGRESIDGTARTSQWRTPAHGQPGGPARRFAPACPVAVTRATPGWPGAGRDAPAGRPSARRRGGAGARRDRRPCPEALPPSGPRACRRVSLMVAALRSLSRRGRERGADLLRPTPQELSWPSDRPLVYPGRYIKTSYKCCMLQAWAVKTPLAAGIVTLVALPPQSGQPSTDWLPGP